MEDVVCSVCGKEKPQEKMCNDHAKCTEQEICEKCCFDIIDEEN